MMYKNNALHVLERALRTANAGFRMATNDRLWSRTTGEPNVRFDPNEYDAKSLARDAAYAAVGHPKRCDTNTPPSLNAVSGQLPPDFTPRAARRRAQQLLFAAVSCMSTFLQSLLQEDMKVASSDTLSSLLDSFQMVVTSPECLPAFTANGAALAGAEVGEGAVDRLGKEAGVELLPTNPWLEARRELAAAAGAGEGGCLDDCLCGWVVEVLGGRLDKWVLTS